MSKIKVPESIVQEISEFLSMGFTCYIHKKTFEFECITEHTFDESLYADIRKKIEMRPNEYVSIEPQNSNESFRMMVEFAEGLADEELRLQLIHSLNRPHPFQNFKHIIESSGIYRQEWFDFKSAKHIAYAESQLNLIE